MDVDVVERHVAHELDAQHCHPRHPEEQDVEAGGEHRGGVEHLELGGLLGPAEGRERPEPRGEPRVEHVGVLAERSPALRARGEIGAGDVHAPVLVAVPHRDAVAPPELARDRPVADVLHPVEVGLAPRARDDLDLAGAHRLDRGLRERLGPHVPLLGDERLHHRPAAVADPDRVAVGLDAVDEAELLHVLHDALAGLEAVEPRVLAGQLGHLAVEADHAADGQVVPLADLEVGRVVTGGDLDDPGPELRIDRLVGDDLEGDVPLHRGHLERLAHVLLVALVLGVHRHRGVAELGLRPHGAEGERTVLDVDELRVLVLALDLQIRQHGLAARAPVHDVVALVDEPLFPQPHEDLAHRGREARVHREALAGPVAGGAEPLELADDGAARLLLPLPDPGDEGLPPEVLLGLALLLELPLHHVLGRDARVVGARHPERVVAVHPLVADQDVLERVVERVPQVERPRDVGRRDDDAVGLLRRVRLGVEVAALFPDAVPVRLDAGRIVAVGDFAHVNASL